MHVFRVERPGCIDFLVGNFAKSKPSLRVAKIPLVYITQTHPGHMYDEKPLLHWSHENFRGELEQYSLDLCDTQ